MKIAVAGTGYVGLSLAVLLAQHHDVVALDIVPEKIDLLNNKQSPIVDAEIEDFLAINPNATMIIKSTIPVGYTDSVKAKFAQSQIATASGLAMTEKTLSLRAKRSNHLTNPISFSRPNSCVKAKPCGITFTHRGLW